MRCWGEVVKKDSQEKSNRYRIIGIILTTIWMTMVGFYLVNASVNPFALDPSQFGDFLAGAIGPVGILWIILGFWQQGDELRSSVRALELQSEELRHSVTQQKALVEVTRGQAEITERQADAQMEALGEERRARLVASLPKLEVYSAGGMSSGNRGLKTNVFVENIGDDCSSVEMFVDDGERKSVFKVPVFPHSHKETIIIPHTEESHLNFIIELRYIDRDGNTGFKKYGARRPNPKQVGFELLIIDSTERELRKSN